MDKLTKKKMSMNRLEDNTLIRMNNCLLNLSQFIHQGAGWTYTDIAEKIAISAVKGLMISRASVWQLDEQLSHMTCIALCEDGELLNSGDFALDDARFPHYFSALAAGRFIVASDARSHDDTKEFTDNYLIPNNIYSMMDALIRHNGKTVGILCCEHKFSVKDWDLLDQNYAGMLADTAERAISDLIIKQDANIDRLTQLPNRSNMLKSIDASSRTLLLAIFDIQDFTSINDLYGESIGDATLKKIAQYLIDQSAKLGKLYSYGNDRFALLVESDRIDIKKLISHIEIMANHGEPLSLLIDDTTIVVKLNTAVSTEAKEHLVSSATLALKALKKQNIAFLLYNKLFGLEAEIANNIMWHKRIKEAIDQEQVVCVYQPIINNSTMKIEKYEALVRIINTVGETYTPNQFLDIAKRTNQYLKISQEVFRRTFATLEDIQSEFSINLTKEDIFDSETVKLLESFLDHPEFHGRVVLEIVESEALDKSDHVYDFLDRMRARGCSIAIDDFGTGYSNFEYLIRLSPEYIKIDGSMIKNIDHDPVAEEVVKTIIDLAKKRGMKTIAEYVSSKHIFDKVVALGIDYSQGYFIGKPQAISHSQIL